MLHLPGRLVSLLDSRPLGSTMEQRLDWDQLDRNLRGAGWVHTAGVVATSCARGRGTVFVQGKNLVTPKRDAEVDYAKTTLRSEHVMASAAIPVAFRPVLIEAPPKQRGWYIDGGVKVNAPIKPALALGVDRVAAVATTPDPAGRHAASQSPAEPDIFDAATVVMHALLVDRMADDIRALRRVNTLVSAGRSRTPGGYRAIPNLYLGPPKPGLISDTANDVFSSRYSGIKRPFSDLGLLGRLLAGTRENHGELLSFVFFDREFHKALIELGAKHACHARWVRKARPCRGTCPKRGSPGERVRAFPFCCLDDYPFDSQTGGPTNARSPASHISEGEGVSHAQSGWTGIRDVTAHPCRLPDGSSSRVGGEGSHV